VKPFTALIILFCFFSQLPAQDSDDCLDCHADKDITKLVDDTTEVSVYVDTAILENSVHEGFECTDCHQPGEDHPDETALPPVNCGGCHEDAAQEYSLSIHALAHLRGKIHTARCQDCHGAHNILPADDKNSTVAKKNLGRTCSVCHSRPDVLKLLGKKGAGPFEGYKESIHGQSRANDVNSTAPVCSNCHNYHDILPRTDPKCSYAKINIPQTCGKCHVKEEKAYRSSVHWNAILRGHFEAPTCNDCHSEHNIYSESNPEPGDTKFDRDTKICKDCHSSTVMMARYGLDPERFASYSKSYHGLAARKGAIEAATCVSCHETHAIKSPADTSSSVNVANLEKTCGNCHQNIDASFIQIDVHPIDQQVRNPTAYLFRVIYTWLLIIVIGGMILHNLIIIAYYIRQRRKKEKGMLRYQRFKGWEVYQHLLMLLSFSVLALSGFMLKFPDAGWVRVLYALGLSEPLRALIHRSSAVVMIVISLIQGYYLIFTKNGRKEFSELVPTAKDFVHLFQNMAYHLGFRSELPEYGRFDYAEKAEYLALIWGVIVMALSGVILWFPEFIIGRTPFWVFETAEVIHYFEAWLATLAIIVWHWFFVVLHPEKYPVSLTWIDGKITEEEMKRDHPLEYAKLKKAKTDDAENAK